MISSKKYRFTNHGCELFKSNDLHSGCDIVTELAFVLNKKIAREDIITIRFDMSDNSEQTLIVPVKFYDNVNSEIVSVLSNFIFSPIVNICCLYLPQIYVADLGNKWLNYYAISYEELSAYVCVNDTPINSERDCLGYYLNGIYLDMDTVTYLRSQPSLIAPLFEKSNFNSCNIHDLNSTNKMISYYIWNIKSTFVSVSIDSEIRLQFDHMDLDVLQAMTGYRDRYYLGSFNNERVSGKNNTYYIKNTIDRDSLYTNHKETNNNDSNILINISMPDNKVTAKHIYECVFDKNSSFLTLYKEFKDLLGKHVLFFKKDKVDPDNNVIYYAGDDNLKLCEELENGDIILCKII